MIYVGMLCTVMWLRILLGVYRLLCAPTVREEQDNTSRFTRCKRLLANINSTRVSITSRLGGTAAMRSCGIRELAKYRIIVRKERCNLVHAAVMKCVVMVQLYMDPLVKRLGASPPLNVEVMPLIDTLIHLTLALGGNVEPYALPLLQHALATAAANLSAVQAADTSDKSRAASATPPQPPSNGVKYPGQQPTSGGHTPPDGTMFALPIVTYALDLISALIEVLRRSSDALLSAVGYDAVPSLALACARCPNACVQQSAFALIGELANQVPNVVAQCHGAAMLHLCYEMLDPDRIMEVRSRAVSLWNGFS